jgi:hypothetical protein
VPGAEGTQDGRLTDVLSTPVYGETLTVLHVAPAGGADQVATVAATQSAAGWSSTVVDAAALAASPLEGVDVVVLWGLTAAESRDAVAGRTPTVVVFDEDDVRRVLRRPDRWVREFRRTPHTNLLLVPAGLAERYTRTGPPVPLAHRPADLPAAAAVELLSGWLARAYAYGRR